LERVRRVPGTRAASLANITPLAGSRWNTGIAVEGYQRRADEKPYVDFNAVSPAYFETLSIPILAGRDFRAEDNPPYSADPQPNPAPNEVEKLGPPAPVAIVNEAFAKHYFPNQSPVGKHFTHGEKFDMAKAFEIVGIVKDSKYFGIRQPVESMVYVPVWRFSAGGNTLCVRSTGRPQQLVGSIRREVANLDAAVPVFQTLTMDEQFDNTISQERIVTTLCGFFGGLATGSPRRTL
jgi:hypothetical protein